MTTMHVGRVVHGGGRVFITHFVATDEKSPRRRPLLLTTGRVPVQYKVREEIAANRDKLVSMAGR